MSLEIINSALFDEYANLVPKGLQNAFDALKEAELSTPNFSFYTSVASVFSSKIEGEAIELDSYIKHKRDGMGFRPDYTKKIDDLYNAYVYAQQQPLNETTIKKAHQLLSKHLVLAFWQGKYRNQNMYVATDEGKIEYVAAPPHLIADEMGKLMADVKTLIGKTLSVEEVFFYAAMVHLVFVKIHPWVDGNGRTARLIEKWFMAQKLGSKAWFVQSEKMYYGQHNAYYQNIRNMGLEYGFLDYGKALSFLLMLPNCLNFDTK